MLIDFSVTKLILFNNSSWTCFFVMQKNSIVINLFSYLSVTRRNNESSYQKEFVTCKALPIPCLVKDIKHVWEILTIRGGNGKNTKSPCKFTWKGLSTDV